MNTAAKLALGLLVLTMLSSLWWADRQARKHIGDPHSLAVRPDRRGRYE